MKDVSDYPYPCDLDPALRRRIVAGLRASYDRFDPADFQADEQGRYPEPRRGGASTLGWLYPAMHLVLSPRPGREKADRRTGRAMILRAIRQGQYRNPGHPADGAWHWSVPAEAGEFPRDRNTAGFMGCALVRIWANDPLRLADWTEADLAAFKDAVGASADAAIRHRVRIGYANPRILDFYLLTAAADLLDERRYRQAGREQLDEFLRYARTTDAFEEYLSPTYTAVNLSAAVCLAHYTRATADEAAASELLERAWGHLTSAAHGPTRQVAGPHARAYHDTLQQNPDQLYGWMHLAAPEVFPAVGDDDAAYARAFNALCAPGLYVPLGVPEAVANSMRSTFAQPVEARVLTEWIGRCAWKPPYDLTRPDPAAAAPRFRLATRYRTARYCVGSVNEQDGWLQRRSVLAYWLDERGEPTGVKWQVVVEVDDPDTYLGDWLFMMGVELVSVQSQNRVIGAYLTAPIAPVRPGDELTAPARVHSIGRADTTHAADPAVWLLGTHWRQGIGREDLRQHLKGLWIGITPVGAGRRTAMVIRRRRHRSRDRDADRGKTRPTREQGRRQGAGGVSPAPGRGGHPVELAGTAADLPAVLPDRPARWRGEGIRPRRRGPSRRMPPPPGWPAHGVARPRPPGPHPGADLAGIRGRRGDPARRVPTVAAGALPTENIES